MAHAEPNPYVPPDPNFPGDVIAATAAEAPVLFRISGAASAADTVHALRLGTPRWWWRFTFTTLSGAALFAFALVRLWNDPSGFYVLPALLGVILVSSGISQFFQYPRTVARWVREGLGPCAPHEAVFTREQVRTQTDTTTTIDTWSAYVKHRRSPRVALLFYRGGTFRVVSRTSFGNHEEWQRFLALLEEKLPRG